jgi:catechol 2,3-dioxygenase-like lactoylglutathione lyase family enzyme
MKILFRHIGIVTQNVEESKRFYEILGFNLVKECIEDIDFISRISDHSGTYVVTHKMVSDNGDMIELLSYSGVPRRHLRKKRTLFDRGLAHFALTVENVNTVCRALAALENARFLSLPQTSPDGAAIVAFCIAPEGTFIELVEEVKTQ